MVVHHAHAFTHGCLINIYESESLEKTNITNVADDICLPNAMLCSVQLTSFHNIISNQPSFLSRMTANDAMSIMHVIPLKSQHAWMHFNFKNRTITWANCYVSPSRILIRIRILHQEQQPTNLHRCRFLRAWWRRPGQGTALDSSSLFLSRHRHPHHRSPNQKIATYQSTVQELHWVHKISERSTIKCGWKL